MEADVQHAAELPLDNRTTVKIGRCFVTLIELEDGGTTV